MVSYHGAAVNEKRMQGRLCISSFNHSFTVPGNWDLTFADPMKKIFVLPFLLCLSFLSRAQEKATLPDNPPRDTTGRDSVYTRPDVAPDIPGGLKGWLRHLKANLDPDIAEQNGAPAGRYMVKVKFLVNKGGYASQVKAITNHGYGMELEAEKLVKKVPYWEPAVNDDRRVNAIHTVIVNFEVPDEPENETELRTVVMHELPAGDKMAEEDKNLDYNQVFSKVEIEPEFPGGPMSWKRHLERNQYMAIPEQKGAPAGTYRVVVKFIVDLEGNVSSVEPLTNFGYEMETTIVNLISKGPRWLPAMQNGRKVKAYRQVYVNFVIKEK
jgi:hypothetical protein